MSVASWFSDYCSRPFFLTLCSNMSFDAAVFGSYILRTFFHRHVEGAFPLPIDGTETRG